MGFAFAQEHFIYLHNFTFNSKSNRIWWAFAFVPRRIRNFCILTVPRGGGATKTIYMIVEKVNWSTACIQRMMSFPYQTKGFLFVDG